MKNLRIQTLGRLRRMPKAVHYGDDILDCAYLYTLDGRIKKQLLMMAVDMK